MKGFMLDNELVTRHQALEGSLVRGLKIPGHDGEKLERFGGWKGIQKKKRQHAGTKGATEAREVDR